MQKQKLVRRGDLRPHGDPAKIPVAIELSLSLIVSGKMGDIPWLTEAHQGAVDEVVKKAGAQGREVYLRVGEVHPVPHDVLVALVPRRVHYEASPGKQACDTPHVSPRNLTTDDEKITCKLCRKIRGLG